MEQSPAELLLCRGEAAPAEDAPDGQRGADGAEEGEAAHRRVFERLSGDVRDRIIAERHRPR